MAVKYTKEGKNTLPATDANLATEYTAGEYTAAGADDGSYATLNANNWFLIHQFKDSNAVTNANITASWNGQIDYAASLGTVYLQVYDQVGAAWSVIASNNTVGINTDFNLTGAITTNQSKYFDANSSVAWRVYQSVQITANDPFFESFPLKVGSRTGAYSDGTLSVHAVNIPLSMSFNNVAVLMTFSSAALSNWSGVVQFGLYSLNGSTLSLANSASVQLNIATRALSWISMATSATQDISAGQWYFGFNIFTNGVGPHTSASFWQNRSFVVANAEPVFAQGRMTASTNAVPAAIATSDLDITGGDAIQQPYIIITA